MFYTDANGVVYGEGSDMPYGGREATKEEIDAYNANREKLIAVDNAKQLLNDTQWVESYIIRHEQGIALLPYDSNKWSLHAERLRAITTLKENGL